MADETNSARDAASHLTIAPSLGNGSQLYGSGEPLTLQVLARPRASWARFQIFRVVSPEKSPGVDARRVDRAQKEETTA